MKNKFVADGPFRFLRGKKAVTLEAIEKKYAKELATAELHQKETIYQQIAKEFPRHKNHEPSSAILW